MINSMVVILLHIKHILLYFMSYPSLRLCKREDNSNILVNGLFYILNDV